MFGMGFSELMIIAIIAILFLGPEKLPDAMVQVAKFFKTFKKSINEAKSSIEQEMHIQELKDEALEYKKKLDSAATSAKKELSFDELEEIKSSTQGLNETFKEVKEDIAKTKRAIQDPMGTNRTVEKIEKSETIKQPEKLEKTDKEDA
ncbi:Sec-independent protein translocase protein TatB [Sulfurospirillum sp. 1612]|uniref:Sec-independent protein translocase protein TatB n=1 Tax=Sulfurospirillum sp. 1612 TaxID=3094835 RepID=UPI002F956B5C